MVTNLLNRKDVKGKFLGMRKEQEFTVYPFGKDSQEITVQSDKAIGVFNRHTGKGLLNYKGSNSKHFLHLNKAMGAVEFTFPVEFINECLKQES
jgi:hypothetical protein